MNKLEASNMGGDPIIIRLHYSTPRRTTHLAARPTGQPDYKDSYEVPTARLLATLVATTVDQFNHLLPAIMAAQDTNPLVT
jgi:hypothetical protein